MDLDEQNWLDQEILPSYQTFSEEINRKDDIAHQLPRRERMLSMTRINEDMNIACQCKRSCYVFLDTETVITWRQKYHLIGRGIIQQQRLLELYSETIFSRKHGEKMHLVNDQLYCSFVWYRIIIGISKSTYARVVKLERVGVKYIQHNIQRSQGQLGQIALGYMKHYVSMVGDHNPENGRVMLPAGLTIQNIYRKFCDTHEYTIIKQSHFYQLWKDNMKHVTHQKDCRMSKCNVCVLARHMLEQSHNSSLRQKIYADRDEHLSRQRREREAYYERRASAVDNPREKTSLIIDGMDQSKTNIPHFRGWAPPKELDPSSLLQTHITGALVHGKKAFMYIDILQWPHDANLTINCILHALVMQATNRTLTKTLYIQLDNCGRENKNKFVFGLLALLVARKYVKEVFVSFLMVGHTHEDIDARFSRISASLKRNDAKTLPQLLDTIREAQRGIENVPMVLKKVFNVRDWLADHLNQLNNHSYPHAYKIYEDQVGHVCMKYKNWCEDEIWLPQGDGGLELFKLDDLGNQSLPTGEPNIVEADFSRKHDAIRLADNIRKATKYLSPQEQHWWTGFLEQPVQAVSGEDDGGWYLNLLNKTLTEVSETRSNEVFSPLQILMHKERLVPEVHSGPRKKKTTTSLDSGQLNIGEVGSMIGVVDNGNLKIGQVVNIGAEILTTAQYSGTLSGKWEVIKRHGEVVIDVIERKDIKEEWIFFLTDSGRLPNKMKKALAHYF